MTNSFLSIKIFLFCFYCTSIWINYNRTLVVIDFNLNFLVYLCIWSSCLFMYMVPTWSNYCLKVISRQYFLFLYVERMKTFFLIKTAFYNKSSFLVILTKQNSKNKTLEFIKIVWKEKCYYDFINQCLTFLIKMLSKTDLTAYFKWWATGSNGSAAKKKNPNPEIIASQQSTQT